VPPPFTPEASISALVHYCDPVAEDFHSPALRALRDDAAGAVDVRILARLQEDAAALLEDAGGVKRARVPHDGSRDADAARLRDDAAEVGCVVGSAGDLDLHAGVAVSISATVCPAASRVSPPESR
jgi:uncharacterized protein YgbK (DUF1537 family)